MEAKELMIGDWVECTYWTPSKQLKVAEIRRIMDNEIKIGVYSDDLVLIFRQSEVKPIPLTPKILEKNGFKQIGKKFIWGEIDDDLIEIIPSINNSYRITVSVADIMISCSIWCSYAHQLQHALRLCGIKKEIEL